MANLFRSNLSSRQRDNVVRRHPFGFIHEQDAVRRCSALNGFTSFLQNFFFDFRQRSAHPRAGSQCMPAAAKFLANRAYIHAFVFGTHADAHLSVRKFFEKRSDDDAVNCAEMID